MYILQGKPHLNSSKGKVAVNQVATITQYKHHISSTICFPCSVIVSLSQKLQVIAVKRNRM
jgi:hypothetical protein